MTSFSSKNENRISKVLLYSFEDPEGRWELDGDDWHRWAVPVYRSPQGSWNETQGFTRQKIWFIERTNSESKVDPNNISFAPWLQCYWDSQAGRWVVIKTGGGASGFLQFQFDEDEYETEEVPRLCADRLPTTAGSHRVRVINAPCGGGVQGMDAEGYITVTDPGGYLKDRDYRELPGRTGFAELLGGEPDEYGYSSGGCGWVITWVNFFREITIIKDVIFQVNQIVLKREKIVVWDNCRLPDEIIVGADCQAEDEYA